MTNDTLVMKDYIYDEQRCTLGNTTLDKKMDGTSVI